MNIYSPASLENIKGVGEVSLAKLRQAGLRSRFDLIYFFPRSYQEISFVDRIANIKPGFVTLKARAENIQLKRGNRALTWLNADLVDKSGRIQAVWFNQPYRQNQLKNGQFYFSGKFEFARGRYQLINPSVQAVKTANRNLARDHLQSIYPQVRGLKSSFFDRVIADLKPDILTLNESLPAVVVDKLELLARSDSVFYLHFPRSRQQIEAAQRREQIEAAFVAMLASLINGQKQRQLATTAIPTDVNLLKSFVSKLPFKLTDDQKRAIWRIAKSIGQSQPMNLLLQGDVGSGKTVVATAISLLVARAGKQVALMAPTEILAQQHLNNLRRDLQPFKLRIELLTSALKAKARRELLQAIADGKVDIVIGTHALIQEKVIFRHLALAIIDEQHRFGVKQRQALVQKAVEPPHMLSMTATPIPRSLALTLKHELAIVSLRQKPSRRQPITTQLFSDHQRGQVYDLVRAELAAGHQAYWVCSRIDEVDETQNQKSLEKLQQQFSQQIFKDYRVAIIHGRLKAEQKAQIMADFLARKIDLLLATTVVEVGVDSANATVMVVDQADNYGLSQLHQLRGRIGRSELPGFCYLLTEQADQNQRLQAIAQSEDGFYLAEVDLKLRGMGSLYGVEQSGWFSSETSWSALKEAQAGLEIYQNWLKKQGLDIDEHLASLPELQARINQFDQVTVLN